MDQLSLAGKRARDARLGKSFGHGGYLICMGIAGLGIVGGLLLITSDTHYGWSAFGVGLLALMPALYWKHYLKAVPPSGKTVAGRLSYVALQRLNPKTTYSPVALWNAIRTNPQAVFFTNHLLLANDSLESCFSADPEALESVLTKAADLADERNSETLEIGHLTAALFYTSPRIADILTHQKLTLDDLVAVDDWLGRVYEASQRKPQNFGGIGRDWASGFTPRLNQFGHNISESIEHHGSHFGALVDGPGVHDMKNAFSQGAGSIALVGQHGIGKTSHAYALAQSVLAEAKDPALAHKQIIELDASAIIAASRGHGDLEYLITALINEAHHAGNIILFFDDAQLFFQDGTGTLNATHILLPAVQGRAVQIIFAMTPHDYEQLRANNMAFAGLLTPVMLRERPEAEVLQVLTDTATQLEYRHKTFISYEAIKAAYRLSGRYETDLAYPGKAISLLEQSLTHPDGNVITTSSVEAAIEQTRGVKAGGAAPVEADQLLHLEDQIHERMVNQSHAVRAVSDALRRARAGVSNPNRPIGSFLFLGPTGVGKTELAKAIAGTYFGNEDGMVRLDMSEYQQESDVSRILSDGQGESKSLLMQVRQQPFSVVLLDEIEKAHPNILNLLLQLLDEGKLTDSKGRSVSFKDAVVIATSNAGADKIREHIAAGEELEQFEQQLTDELINSGQFRPELLNRFDEIVLFRPLKPEELAQVVRLMLGGINQTLSVQNISVELTDAAIDYIVEKGNDPRLGARPMRRTLQKAVENTVAGKILRGEAKPGDHIRLDIADFAM